MQPCDTAQAARRKITATESFIKFTVGVNSKEVLASQEILITTYRTQIAARDECQ